MLITLHVQLIKNIISFIHWAMLNLCLQSYWGRTGLATLSLLYLLKILVKFIILFSGFSPKGKKKNHVRQRSETDADLTLLTKRLHKQYDIYHYIEQKFDELYKKVIQICPA